MPTDIEIAQNAHLERIGHIAARASAKGLFMNWMSRGRADRGWRRFGDDVWE